MTSLAYSEYKESGVSWLGAIPKHWSLHKTKFLFERMHRPVTPGDEIVTAFRDGAVVLRSERRTEGFTNALKEIGYQGIRQNDLVIHAMDGFAGAVGVAESSGKSTPVYSVCRARSSSVNPWYYGYLLRHMALSGFINSLAKGVRERSTEFKWAEAGNLILPAPPYSEQIAIVSFITNQTKKTDALIAEQQKLLMLLAEKRQATISHAVRHGLKIDAATKNGGALWLANIPVHWEVTPLKRQFHVVTEKATGRSNPIALENVEGWTGRYVSSENEFEADGIAFAKRDILFGKLRPYLAKAFLAQRAGEAVGDFFVLRPCLGLVARFAQYQLLSRAFIDVVSSSTFGSKMPRVSWEFLSNMPFVIPSIAEQTAIVEFLDADGERIEMLMVEQRRAIKLLKERRSALISAAVTGKIDVRDYIAAEEPAFDDATPIA